MILSVANRSINELTLFSMTFISEWQTPEWVLDHIFRTSLVDIKPSMTENKQANQQFAWTLW